MIASPNTAVRVALAALAVTMVACGSDDNDATTVASVDAMVPVTTEHPHEDTVPSADEPVSSQAAAARVIEIEAVDYAFESLPDSVPAGTRLTLTNGANVELHELVAIRLADDETRSVEEIVHLPQDELGAIIGAGPPAAVLLAAPGGEQIAAVGDGTLTDPGRYLVFCSIPSGVAPEVYLEAAAASNGAPPQVEGGPPHFVHGMFAELVVE